ncbi:MAG: CBS domain-containing protein [Myxococcales bacterium]|nr:CBS domain-containing protein [Myxococcales bacterium]MCB9718806.1 CBS domain-containing protein [Myxococcales bacterium]
MQVQDLMTDALVTIKPVDSVRTALLRMEDQEIRHLPVVEGKQLIGMVSDRDLREYRLPVMEELDNPEYADDLLETPVSEVMNANLVTLDPGESLKTAIDLMLEYGVGALPVVDRRGDELVGIVSYVDLLKHVRSLLD